MSGARKVSDSACQEDHAVFAITEAADIPCSGAGRNSVSNWIEFKKSKTRKALRTLKRSVERAPHMLDKSSNRLRQRTANGALCEFTPFPPDHLRHESQRRALEGD